MPLQKLPVRSLDTEERRRLVAERINGILGFDFDDSRVRTAAEVAAGVTPVNYAYAPGDALRHGYATTSGTGSATDQTAELKRATDSAAQSVLDSTVRIPGGFALCAGLTFTRGTSIVGTPSSTHYAFGNLIYAGNSTDNFLNWTAADSSGGPNCIKDIQLAAGSAVNGTDTTGAAIRLLATSQALRPGETRIENVLVDGTAGGFGRGIYIDGSAATTAGSTGVRNVRLDNLRIGGCSVDNEYARFHWVTHMTGGRLQVDQGSGTGVAGIRFTGTSFNVILSELIINGNVLIEDDMTDWHCHGLIGNDLTIAATVNRLSFIGHIAGDLGITAGATNIQILASVGGDVTIGSGVTGCLIGKITGTVSNSSTSFFILDTDTFTTALSTRGSFTATLTGVDSSVTGTARWERTGDVVTLRLPALSGTSNATTCTITGLPAALNPDQEHNMIHVVTDNGSQAVGGLNVQTDGVIRLNTGVSGAGAFTASGTKASKICSITYALDLG